MPLLCLSTFILPPVFNLSHHVPQVFSASFHVLSVVIVDTIKKKVASCVLIWQVIESVKNDHKSYTRKVFPRKSCCWCTFPRCRVFFFSWCCFLCLFFFSRSLSSYLCFSSASLPGPTLHSSSPLRIPLIALLLFPVFTSLSPLHHSYLCLGDTIVARGQMLSDRLDRLIWAQVYRLRGV